jgi:EAL and modified HD-GYP domain-containing signal transduction protein
VWAYELRYASESERSVEDRSDDATSALILSAFGEFGLERVVGDKKAFINASYGTVTGEMPLPVPSQRVALQVRDYDHSIDTLVRCLGRRKDEGFSLVLEDFVWTADAVPLLHLVDYVKLDFQRLRAQGLRDHLAQLRPFPIKPIVTGLCNSAQVRLCVTLGVECFQGDFLFKPQLMARKELPNSFLVMTDLLGRLQDPDVEFQEIEALVKRDPGLSVAVLRFLNSSAYGFRQEVSSVRQAVALLGLSEFTKWTLLVSLSSRFDSPSELLVTALVRARTCENYARATGGSPDTAFIVGLLSVLDALLDRPMQDVLRELPLTAEISGAVLDLEGPAGRILERALGREQGSYTEDDEAERTLTEAWMEAVEWAETTRGAGLIG